MSNTNRTRKSPAILEDTDKGTSITWSVRCARLAKTTAVVLLFSALAACGVQNDSMGVENVAASQEMSIAVYNSKADCDAAANMNWTTSSTNAQELNFSCDSVDTAALGKTDTSPVSPLPVSDIASPTTANTLVSSSPLAPASAPTTPVVVHGGGGGNPMMWYMLGNMMSNRSSAVSSGFTPASTSIVAPSAFINSAGNGKMTMSAAPQFASPTPAQYAGLKANGGIIGSNLAHAASYKASTSSIASKSSAHSSVGHSSGGHGGGGGGGG